MARPEVLLTNDDGPPSSMLIEQGWSDNFRGTHPDTDKCWSDTRRPIHKERGEIGEWILVDGTPSTCTNIGLFTSAEILDMPNAAPISLVLSGPNYGRNTGNAFSLSSGTLGAALAGATSGVRGIAMSYGHFQKDPPTPAHSASGAPLSASRSAEIARIATFYCTQIIKQLWDAWSKDVCVSAYSINVPLAETLLDPTVVWTRVWPSQLNKVRMQHDS
ncbi:hypothetical protein MVES1_003063 [Malassezia vespertilionis]|uniref:uncharacterized protein n=1 Tax=Malassezia vespertilionis TaxID=2020962 RepID=UPI0024B1A814|nr:uncharacterized protein MVES1_003063 [Malassezia vespertilionis]WFD07694.1 hypothetical protein MVES1_003063 [Malassezia vespertilionis]